MIEKTRNIPLSDLYSCLQLEYIAYFLRSKIYCKEFADNYRKICESKKEKIEKISIKNNLPSIFNNEKSKEKHLDKFIPDWGTPHFTYKDASIKAKMEIWDKHYFFSKGASIKFKLGDEIVIGVIQFNDKNAEIVTVLDEYNDQRDLHYNNISRILPEDFFSF